MSDRIEVTYDCPACHGTKAVQSVWCYECITQRGQWVKVGYHLADKRPLTLFEVGMALYTLQRKADALWN